MLEDQNVSNFVRLVIKSGHDTPLDQHFRVTNIVWNQLCDSVFSVVNVDVVLPSVAIDLMSLSVTAGCGLPSADVDSIFPTVAADSFFLTLWSDNVDFALSFDDFESIVDEADVGRFVT